MDKPKAHGLRLQKLKSMVKEIGHYANLVDHASGKEGPDPPVPLHGIVTASLEKYQQLLKSFSRLYTNLT